MGSARSGNYQSNRSNTTNAFSCRAIRSLSPWDILRVDLLIEPPWLPCNILQYTKCHSCRSHTSKQLDGKGKSGGFVDEVLIRICLRICLFSWEAWKTFQTSATCHGFYRDTSVDRYKRWYEKLRDICEIETAAWCFSRRSQGVRWTRARRDVFRFEPLLSSKATLSCYRKALSTFPIFNAVADLDTVEIFRPFPQNKGTKMGSYLHLEATRYW